MVEAGAWRHLVGRFRAEAGAVVVEEAAGDRRRVAEAVEGHTAAGVEAGLLEAAPRDLEGARRAPRAS